MNQVFDPLRKDWVEASPEEKVRQKWLAVMTMHLSFPKELIVVEKSLRSLPHISLDAAMPDRRIDILAFTKENEGLKPLLLIECKCIPLTEKALYQVKGYNDFVGASYVAIANEEHIRVGFMDQELEFSMIDFLPAYSLLIKAVN